VLQIVVTVAVMVVLTVVAPVPDVDVMEAEVLDGSVVVPYLEAEDVMLVAILEIEEEEEIGVQSGRVKVPLKLPDPP